MSPFGWLSELPLLCDRPLAVGLRPGTHRYFFFFNDTATTEIYTLSLHDALPICLSCTRAAMKPTPSSRRSTYGSETSRSEEHTSELQSQSNLVCRLLLEKKKERLEHAGLAMLSDSHTYTALPVTNPTRDRTFSTH